MVAAGGGMQKQGYRRRFYSDDNSSKGSPYRGRISGGRSLYTDEHYGDRDLREESVHNGQELIWDLDEMGIHHPELLSLVGDELVGKSFAGKGPKGYQRSDERIHEEVCEALYLDDRIDASGITVEVDNGIVFLRGDVRERRVKKMAERCIENLPGVEDVQNELRLL
jgi:osmotically-inducible protein OsmY